MTISRKYHHRLVVLAAAWLVLAGAHARAQPPRDRAAASPAAHADGAALATGWAALAAGRTEEAVKSADSLLARRPGNHRAVDLKIEATAAADPLRALDAYEAWLNRSRVEDVFLLVAVARGTLLRIGASDDRALALQALQKLAQSGDPSDTARVEQFLKSGPSAGVKAQPQRDVQLALEGDAAAAGRLTAPEAAKAVPPQSLAKALGAAGPVAVPMLRSLLKHPSAPVRMDAALSLGKIGATDALPDLKALMKDPEVRSYAAVAAARLGDVEAEAVVQELLGSPVMDMRLLGAQAYQGKGTGPWVQALMPALKDPDGLTRIRAAEMLAPVAPDAALPVLLEASKDPNPVVRADVVRVFEKTGLIAADPAGAVPATGTEGAIGLEALRRRLRDPEPSARLHAAGAILGMVKGAS